MSTKQRLFLTAEMCLGMGSIMSLIGNLFAMGWTTSAFHAFFRVVGSDDRRGLYL
jgi:hypothetical protein